MTADWSSTYAATFASRGIRLRPGITFDDLALMLTAASEGLTLRAAADSPDRVINHEDRTSLLGLMVMGLVLAFTDPGDHATVRDIFDAEMTQRARATQQTQPPQQDSPQHHEKEAG